jgi:hypothetical protein
VQNNSINKIDPSGHKECDPDDDIDACSYASDVKILNNMLRVRYGINLVGNVLIDDARAFYKAGYYMNKSLNGNFKKVIGQSTVNFTADPKAMGGEWKDNHTINIWMYRQGIPAGAWSPVPVQLIFHEYGHLLDYEILFRGPQESLANRTYRTQAGLFVMGIDESKKYDRQTGLGYYSPCAQNSACLTELHPRALDDEGNTAYEEWADMYMNYVAGNIDNSDAGEVRRNFIQGWLAVLY